MHRLASSSVASVVLLGFVSSVSAADFPRKAPIYAPVAPVFTWTGFYVGVHGGWGWSQWEGGGAFGTSTVDGDGWLAGIHAGYNYQMGNIVLGIEAEYTFADVKHEEPLFAGTISIKNDFYATISGRVGYAFDRFLVFGKGGVAFTRDVWEGNDGLGGTVSGKFNRTGFVVGGGVEYAMWNNFSIKAEYNFMHFGDVSELPNTTGGIVIVGGAANVSENVHIVKGGLNYRF